MLVNGATFSTDGFFAHYQDVPNYDATFSSITSPSPAARNALRGGTSQACAGFGYGMALASDMVRGGSATNVLVIGSEQLSVAMDMSDRSICFIFGDGAGAVVVGPTEDQQLGPVVWASDGSQFDAIRQDIDWISYIDGDDHAKRPYLRMEGTSVFRWAAFEMGKAAHRALEVAKVDVSDLDVFVPHQANSRINELLARNLKLNDTAVIANDIEFTGNTSAASIPLAMEDLLSTGKAKPGDTALLLGYGAGLSYAAQVVVERVAGEGVVAARCAIAAGQFLGDADVHHRRANLLDQCGKIRQAVAPGLGERSDRGRQGRRSGLGRRAVGGVGRRNRTALLQAAGERKGDGRNGCRLFSCAARFTALGPGRARRCGNRSPRRSRCGHPSGGGRPP